MYSQYPIYSSSTQVHVVEETAVKNVGSTKLPIMYLWWSRIEPCPTGLCSVQHTAGEHKWTATYDALLDHIKLVDLTCWVQLHGDDNTGKVHKW